MCYITGIIITLSVLITDLETHWQNAKSYQFLCAYHGVDLRFASLGHVDDIDSVVVEVLQAAMEILPQKGPRLAGQWDSSKTKLEWNNTHTNTRRHVLYKRQESTLNINNEALLKKN